MRRTREVHPPTGLTRLLFRLPIQLYRLNLGWLLGGRLMLLHHVGRKTGKRRQVVIEVVHHDRADGSYTAASGLGRNAAWYRNVLHTPDVTVRVGRRTVPVTAVPLTADEGADVFAAYASRHPVLAKHLLRRLMGIAVDGTPADFRAAGATIPFVRFVPRRR